MKSNRMDMDKLITGFNVPATKSKQEARDAVWQKIESRGDTSKRKTRRLPLYLISAAAAAALLVVAFWVLNPHTPAIELQNHLAKSTQTVLPDSSEVVVQKNTSLRYLGGPSGKRLIELKGEAYFKVTKGEKFKVNFPGGELTVLGTRFNVRAYTAGNIRVECYEGSVSVALPESDCVLKAGEGLVLSGRKMEGPIPIDLSNEKTIGDNLYYWNNRPLSEILSLVCERDGLVMTASHDVLNQRFSGPVNMNNTNQALTIITKAMNLRYRIENNKLTIVENQ